MNDSEVAELEELDAAGEPADMVDNDNVGKLCEIVLLIIVYLLVGLARVEEKGSL